MITLLLEFTMGCELTLLLPCPRWRLVDVDCRWHRTCPVLRCGVVTSLRSARWGVRIISGCLSGTRSVIRGNFRQLYSDCRTQSRQSRLIIHSSSNTRFILSVHRTVWSSSLQLIFFLHLSSVNPATAMSLLATGQRLLPVGTAPVRCCGVTS